MKFPIRIAAVSAIILTVGACAPRSVEDDSAFPVAPRFSNAEVVGVVTTANNGEIETSQPAVQKAASSDVRAFAQQMIADHTASNTRLAALGIANGDSDLEEQLRSSAARTTEVLQQYEGAAFDRAYMDAQIQMHQYVLTSLDNTLIPSATSSALRTELEQTRTSVAAHLERARAIREAL